MARRRTSTHEHLLRCSVSINVSRCLLQHANRNSSEANHNHSPFLQLPPEIRNQIYRYALDQGVVTVRPFAMSVPQPQSFYLLSVCRQIRAEASLLFFSLNSFDFSCMVNIAYFTNRVTTLEKRDAIRSIRLDSFQVQWITGSTRNGCPTLSLLRQLDEIYVTGSYATSERAVTGMALRDMTGRMALEVFFET